MESDRIDGFHVEETLEYKHSSLFRIIFKRNIKIWWYEG